LTSVAVRIAAVGVSRLKYKSLIGALIIGTVAALTWLLGGAIGQQVLHGRSAFTDWRAHHVGIYLLAWLGAVVVISLPILYVVGRRMLAALTEQERSVDAARGIGGLAVRALQGDTNAVDKLVLLLDDHTALVRYQAARALALLDDEDVNPTLFRVVRYWPAPDKLALIDTLRRTQDVRAGKLLMELSNDRSVTVSRKALSALPIVMGRTWRGPSRAEDEQLRRKKGGSRAGTGIPSVMADLPVQMKSNDDRPLITGRPVTGRSGRRLADAGTPDGRPAGRATSVAAGKAPAAAGEAPAADEAPAAAGEAAPQLAPAVEQDEAAQAPQPAVEQAAPPPA
jgi:hypothetical protein